MKSPESLHCDQNDPNQFSNCALAAELEQYYDGETASDTIRALSYLNETGRLNYLLGEEKYRLTCSRLGCNTSAYLSRN
jgi:hypothetical protein